ncbi:hypothetical protein V7157_26905, partial [Neobacillus drentensis]|uniref:hypothetical protein n=1 Tax=Neobacillus drentensis TaxID=220684 RepID=UPI003002FF03
MELKRKGNFNQKIFNRLFLTSSITIIVTVIVLIVTITNYYSDIIIQKEVNINTRTMERVEDYFSGKDADINRAIRDLYVKGDMIDDMSFALNNGYEKYLEYRLDKFSEDQSFIPRNIDTYFNGFFSQDSDINAVSLRSSENPAIEYLIVNNNIRWNKSIIGPSTISGPLFNQGYPHVMEESLPRSRKLRNTITKEIAINNPVTLKKIGVVSIFYSTDRLDKIVKKHEGAPTSIFLLDADGKIVYSVNKGVPLAILDKVKHETNETKIKWEHDNYYINSISNMGDYT